MDVRLIHAGLLIVTGGTVCYNTGDIECTVQLKKYALVSNALLWFCFILVQVSITHILHWHYYIYLFQMLC